MASNSNLEGELRIVLRDIESKIRDIDKELSSVDESVHQDLNALLSEYISKSKVEATPDQFGKFRSRHLPFLKKKKEESLSQAKEKLNRLKQGIALALNDANLA